MSNSLIYELSTPGRRALRYKEADVPVRDVNKHIPKKLLRDKPANLPEVSELDIVRHFTNLSRMNFSVDTHFYPLGSCTMKYNPKINEDMCSLEGFTGLHPYQPYSTTQGILELMWETEELLKEITGMHRFTLQPAAGAHGELLGMMLVRAYHDKKGNHREKVLVPDSSHGTNPASAVLSGYEVVTIKSNKRGEVDVETLKNAMDDKVAALMMTNPNTLGIFERDVREIQKVVHSYDSLLYYDGANANALLGIARPGDMGFDIVHLNLHKTFSTPHGAGGPGSGPIGVNKRLEPYLPVPLVVKDGDKYRLDYDLPDSIGKVKNFYGQIGVIVRAYTYMKMLGKEGLVRTGKASIINANYLLQKLKKLFRLPYSDRCMHEFVASAANTKEYGVSALDIAKCLLDKGIHAPTTYFPLIVEEALMIEPTETESKSTLDDFVNAIEEILDQAKADPEKAHRAPTTMTVTRMDQVAAARNPVLRWKPDMAE